MTCWPSSASATARTSQPEQWSQQPVGPADLLLSALCRGRVLGRGRRLVAHYQPRLQHPRNRVGAPGVEPLLLEPSWYDCCSRHAAASAADPHTGRYPPRRAVVAKYLVPQCNSDRAYSTGNPPYLIYCCRGLTVTLGGRGWPEGMRQAGELFAARSASLKPIGTIGQLAGISGCAGLLWVGWRAAQVVTELSHVERNMVGRREIR